MSSSARPQGSQSGKDSALVKRTAGLAVETAAVSGDHKRRSRSNSSSRAQKSRENRRNFLRHKIKFWKKQVSIMKADLAGIDEDIDAEYAEFEAAVLVRRNPFEYMSRVDSQVAGALRLIRGIRTSLLDEWLEQKMIDLEVERLGYRKEILRGQRRLLTLRQELKMTME